MVKLAAFIVMCWGSLFISSSLKKGLLKQLEYKKFVFDFYKKAKDNLYNSFDDINIILNTLMRDYHFSECIIINDNHLSDYVKKYDVSNIEVLRLDTEKNLNSSEKIYLEAQNEFKRKNLIYSICPFLVFAIIYIVCI